MKKNYFKLFANCIPVKGASRSIICDLQRNDYQLIPNSLYQLLNRFPHFTFEQLIAQYGEAERETLQEYVDFLEMHEFGMWTDEPASFPPLDLAWFSTSKITNSIIDWNATSIFDFKVIFDQLNALDCLHLQLRFFDLIDLERFNEILTLLNRSNITSVEIFLPFDPKITKHDYRVLLRRFPRITLFTVYSAPESLHFNAPEDYVDLIALNYITQTITDETHCGVVHSGYFSTAIDHFKEAQQHNTCLNRKISIDKKGEICNCPSMTQKFGNVKEITLDEAINQPDFKKNWTINKDQIETCKACEFRYICTDCRAYTKDNQPLEKPEKCSYDPYSGQWY